eukprot:6173984-Pleurochrysis_carterae.AAC.1
MLTVSERRASSFVYAAIPAAAVAADAVASARFPALRRCDISAAAVLAVGEHQAAFARRSARVRVATQAGPTMRTDAPYRSAAHRGARRRRRASPEMMQHA